MSRTALLLMDIQGNHLAAQDIGHLVLAGVSTGGIVLSTTLQAAD
ncbi:hypothetical protein [Streptomyces sp. NPDC042319]